MRRGRRVAEPGAGPGSARRARRPDRRGGPVVLSRAAGPGPRCVACTRGRRGRDVRALVQLGQQPLLGRPRSSPRTVIGIGRSPSRARAISSATSTGARSRAPRPAHVRRSGDNDERPQAAAGPQPDRPPIHAAEVAGEDDVLVRQQRRSVARVAHRLPPQGVQPGCARTDQQPHTQHYALALGGGRRELECLPDGPVEQRRSQCPAVGRLVSGEVRSSSGSMTTTVRPSLSKRMSASERGRFSRNSTRHVTSSRRRRPISSSA